MSSNDVITSVTSTEVTVSIIIVSILLVLVICNLLMYTLTRMLTDPKFCVRQMVQRCTQKVPRVRVLEVHPKPRTPSVTGQSHADLISLLSHSANLQLDGVPRETTPSLQLSDSATADIFLSSSLQEDGFIKELAPAYAKGKTWNGDNINMTITCEMQKVEFIKEENQPKSGGITPDTGEITPVTKSDLHIPLPEKQMQTITEVDESKQSGNGQNQKHSVLSQPQVLKDTEKVVTKDSNDGKESPPKGDNSNTTKSDRRTPGKTGGEPVVRQKHGKIMERTDKERDKNGSTEKLKKESVKPKLAVTSATKRADNTSNSSDAGSGLMTSLETVLTGNKIDTRTISADHGTTGTGNDVNPETVADTDKHQVDLTNKYDTPVIKFFKEMKKEIVETSEQTTGNDGLVTDGSNGERKKEIGQQPGENSQPMEVNRDGEGEKGTDRKTEGQNNKEKDIQGTEESSMGVTNKEINVINDSNDPLNGQNGKNNRREFDSCEPTSVSSAEGNEMVGERTNNKDGKENGEVENGNHATDIGDIINNGHGESKQVSSGIEGDKEADLTTNESSDTGVGQDQTNIKTDTGVGQDQNTLTTDIGAGEGQIMAEKENETSGDTKSDLGSDNATKDDVQKDEDNKSAEETDIEKDLNEYIRSNTMDTPSSEDKVDDESDERVDERVDDKNDDSVDKREDYTRVDDEYDDKSDDKKDKWVDDNSDKKLDKKVDDKEDKKVDDKCEDVKKVKDKESTKVNDTANDKGDVKVGKASVKDVKSKTQNKRSKPETVTTKTQTVRARNNKRFKQLKLAK